MPSSFDLQVDPEVFARVPGIRVTSLLFQDVRVGAPSRKIEAVRERVIAAARERVEAARDVRRIPTLAAFIAAFPELGRGPRRAWLDDLFRAIIRHGPFPVVNEIVDATRLLALHYAVPISAFDLSKVRPPARLAMAPPGLMAKVSLTASVDVGGFPVLFDAGGAIGSPFVEMQRAAPGRQTSSVALVVCEASEGDRVDLEDLKSRSANWLGSLVGARAAGMVTAADG